LARLATRIQLRKTPHTIAAAPRFPYEIEETIHSFYFLDGTHWVGYGMFVISHVLVVERSKFCERPIETAWGDKEIVNMVS